MNLHKKRGTILPGRLWKAIGMACCLLTSGPFVGLYAQTTDWEDFLERLVADEENEYTAWQHLYDDLCELHEHPLNVNTATKEELEQIPFLSEKLIENILSYIRSNGPMLTLGELQFVKEMDYETRQLLPFFVQAGKVEKKKEKLSLKNVLRYGKHEWITRLDIPLYERAGFKEYSDSILQRYPNRRYAGDPYYHSFRYRFHYGNHVYAGLTGEKDAGEAFFTHDKKGYDFYSYYFMLKEIGLLKTFLIGNYRLSFGQGLIMNTDFSLGKMAALSSLNSLNKGIRKHSSTSEDNYFRGVAAALRFGKVVWTGFYSDKKQDATLKQDAAVSDAPFITSFKTDGYHRTPLEISKKNNVSNRVAGSNLAYSNKGLRIGLTGVHNVFNRLLNPSNEAYKKYYARGKEFYAYGVDYSYFHPRFTFVGETARSKGGGIATLNCFRCRLSGDYEIMFLQRYYSKDYHALFAHSFSEASGVQNESGLYVGIEAAPLRRVKVTGYFDWFRFPYLKYQVSIPSSRGVDGAIQTVWTPGEKMSFLFKYRYKNKGKDFTLKKSQRKGIDTEVQQKIRLQWQYLPTEVWTFKTTVDYAQVDFVQQESDRGYMLTQNVSYRKAAFPLSVDLTAAYFHTDSYDSRLYVYEKGLLYAFSYPSFYYKGMRCALLLRYDIGKWLTFTAKYGHTRYFDRETIGSAQQEIKGHLKRDIQMQLRMKF